MKKFIISKYLIQNNLKFILNIPKNKKGEKKIKQKSAQKWLPIEEIYEDGIIKIKNNKYVKIIKVNPINYNLKSDLEKKSILNSYKIFLKTCNFNIQILIQSNKEDLTKHILNIKNNINKNTNKNLIKLSENYIEYIKKINYKKKSSSKNFYIVISNENLNQLKSPEIIKSDLKEKYFKIKECLSRCGNSVVELNNKEEIINLFFSFLNTRKNNNKIEEE